MHESFSIIFGRNVTEKVSSQKMLYFLPHRTSASALPGETENFEIASFLLNAACCSANRRTKHSRTTLHCQNDRQYVPDRTQEGTIPSCSMLPSCLMFTKFVTVSVAVSKMEVVLHQAWSESWWTVRYPTVVTTEHVSIDGNFVFQQDSALVHLAFNTVQLLQCKTLNFLSLEVWPCNRPELNSTDYEIQIVVQQL